MSAFRPEPDLATLRLNVRKVPEADISAGSSHQLEILQLESLVVERVRRTVEAHRRERPLANGGYRI
jgi:hypothetical protein